MSWAAIIVLVVKMNPGSERIRDSITNKDDKKAADKDDAAN